MAPTELELMDVIAQHQRGDPERLRQLIADLSWLANEPISSDQLWEKVCDVYESEYNGRHTKTDAKKWLRTMAARLESHLGPKSVKG